MDLTENPWFKLSERMELDFCRELAVQHKILLQEAGEFSGASCCGVWHVACVASRFFFLLACVALVVVFVFFSKIFFGGSFSFNVVKTGWQK